MIEMLKADIQKYEADAAALAKEIAAHDEDISVWEGDIKAATKVREIENTDYVATHKDYSESIDALERAIAVLKKQNFDRKQAEAALLQVKMGAMMTKEQKRIIDTFLQQDPEDSDAEGLAVSAPQANAYEFQSGGVIDMLEKLLDKFGAERDTLEKEETNARHAFEMLLQDLKAAIEQATAAREEKAEIKSKKLQAAAEAKCDLEDTTATMEDDKKYLADLTATCAQKAADFESRQTLRGEEIEAIEKAIEIISSAAVSGNAEKHLPGLVQTKTASLAQLRADSRGPTQHRVAEYLRVKSRQFNSRLLAALAVRV